MPEINENTPLVLVLPYKTITTDEALASQPVHIKIFLVELGYAKIITSG
jgi:hypothetical protein